MTERKLCLQLVSDEDLAEIIGLPALVKSEVPEKIETPAVPEKMNPELDRAALYFIYGRLLSAKYSRISEVLPIISPEFGEKLMEEITEQIEELRREISVFSNVIIRPTMPPQENLDEHCEDYVDQLILAMYKLRNANYPHLEGFAMVVIPGFKEKIAQLGACNLKIIPRLVNTFNTKRWTGILRLQYKMRKHVSNTELDKIMESACCHPTQDRELDILRADNEIDCTVATPSITKEGGHKWYISFAERDKAIVSDIDPSGETMPVGMNFIAVCERKFFAPLEAPLKK
jgi:hypothetical protein